ncbi:MAG TPA: hypothetical protein VFV34_23775 [Blastocatellia bacterium]|nr:hypothetical protein [Blastocatellia bacterium]
MTSLSFSLRRLSGVQRDITIRLAIADDFFPGSHVGAFLSHRPGSGPIIVVIHLAKDIVVQPLDQITAEYNFRPALARIEFGL